MSWSKPSGVSRRSLLAAGTAAGAAGAAGLVAPPAGAATARSGGHLLPDYRPSRPTGWPEHPGKPPGTIGGHIPSAAFTFNGAAHRIALLPFGQPGDAPHPVYLRTPGDPDIAFAATLEAGFGAYYAFRYRGGLRGRSVFRVQSYGVIAAGPGPGEPPGVSFGGGLYAVYEPDVRRGDPGIHETLRWIQVVRTRGTGANRPPEIDNMGRANPYYMDGGLTSVHGTEVCNFNDAPQTRVDGAIPLDQTFLAETFLSHETGAKDASGRAVVEILAGIRYGWHVGPVAP
ncbi:hypothetical protein [Streptomyces sp. NPDC058953]|uniref:hypothetical protein n=1 Tax=unclassified Streptomyces TaxID=2593676 RepID=UPI0036BBA18D